MRKRIIVILISLFGYITGVQAWEGGQQEMNGKASAEETLLANSRRDNGQAVDCTIHVSFTTDDGTRIEGELTFVGIPWWECVAIKIGNFLSKIF